LKGEEIPISAQVVSIVDVYDALTSERCYKKAFDHDTAIQMILDGQCGQFNPMPILCASSGVVSPTAKDCIKCRPKCVPRSPAASRVHANSISAVSSPQPKEDASSFPSVFSGFKI